MKTLTKISSVFTLTMLFFMLQSVKETDYCTEQFDANLAKADTEYQTDVKRCSEATFSSMCLREADLYFEKNISIAVYTFNSCVNIGKE